MTDQVTSPADAGASGQAAPQSAPVPQAPDPGQGAPAHETPGGQRQQADGSPQAATTGAEESQEQKPSRYRRRVETLTTERDSAIRAAEYYRGLAERGGQPRQLDPLQFRSDQEYQRALIQDTARQTQSEFARTQAQQSVDQARQVEQQIWEARTGEFREAVPDFESVAYSTSVPYSNHGLHLMRQINEGPQLAYYLGKNPAEAQRLSQMSPVDTAFELGRLAQRLSGPARKTVSAAPTPVPTVQPGGVPGPADLERMSMSEYIAARKRMN